MIKKLLGLAAQQQADGSYIPSPLALKMATSPKSNYKEKNFEKPYSGNLKVLMVCTEQKNMTMKNGKVFSTGNHPVEMMVPMLHLKNAGFDIDIATPSGKAVKIERWAMPKEDKQVQEIYTAYKSEFENPINLSKFVQTDMQSNNDYIAVFIPGGHGAMLGLPENEDMGALTKWANRNDLFTMVICHGPAALLSAKDTDSKESFIYKGYKMAAFPDVMDQIMPWMGYLPGPVPWKFGEKLNEVGVSIVNTMADASCHVDRKLISGASPLAANDFGILAAEQLLNHVNQEAKAIA